MLRTIYQRQPNLMLGKPSHDPYPEGKGMNSSQMEMAVTRLGAPFCRRRYFVAPNISWGWNLQYEADLIAMSESGYAYEIEIKVSKSDLLRDIEKDKWKIPNYRSNKIKCFYYAVPESLKSVAETWKEMPEGSGIISVDADGYARIVKRAKSRQDHRKLKDWEIMNLYRLSAMRYWDQREANNRLCEELESLRKEKP